LRLGQYIPKPVREVTNFLRPLPDCIIIGAGKSGTTSLHNELAQHPQIIQAREKEVSFFNRDYFKGISHYRANYPILRGRFGEFRRIEGTPGYLDHPHCAKRIKRHLPGAKLIAVLRNPIERAVSHYYHLARLNRESRSLREAMEQEEEEARLAFDRMANDPDDSDPNQENPFAVNRAYKLRGRYLDRIEQYWAHFPKEQLLILRSEDFFERPADILREVTRFIGVDENFEWRDLRPQNVGTNRSKVPEDLRAMLKEYFAPHNRRLEEALGRKMGWE